MSIAKDEILPRYKKENLEDDVSTEVYLENPFLETQLLITETAELVYEKNHKLIELLFMNKELKQRIDTLLFLMAHILFT